MKTIIKTMIVAVIATIGLQSCSDATQEDTTDKTEQIEKQWEMEMNEMKTSLEEAKKSVNSELKGLQSKTESNMENASEEVSEQWKSTQKKLEKLNSDIDERLVKLSKSSSANWEEFKKESTELIDRTGNEIKQISQDVKEWFKTEEAS